MKLSKRERETLLARLKGLYDEAAGVRERLGISEPGTQICSYGFSDWRVTAYADGMGGGRVDWTDDDRPDLLNHSVTYPTEELAEMVADLILGFDETHDSYVGDELREIMSLPHDKIRRRHRALRNAR